MVVLSLKCKKHGTMLESPKFNEPYGIAIHPKNRNIYVTDSSNHHVQILHHNLKLRRVFGFEGSEVGQFNKPKGIAFDSCGHIYVVDSENHRIQVLTDNGGYIRQFGKKGKREGELWYPSAIAIDDHDIVYICEQINQRISLFTNTGKFLTTLEHQYPGAIAVNHEGRLYIVSDYPHYSFIQLL